MAIDQKVTNRMGVADRLFREHPRSLGMSWAGHGIGALAIGGRLIGAGVACVIHAVVPGVFTQTAGSRRILPNVGYLALISTGSWTSWPQADWRSLCTRQ